MCGSMSNYEGSLSMYKIGFNKKMMSAMCDLTHMKILPYSNGPIDMMYMYLPLSSSLCDWMKSIM